MKKAKSKRVHAMHHLLKLVVGTSHGSIRKEHFFYKIQMPKVLSIFIPPVRSDKDKQQLCKHTFSLAQKGFQPSWAWFVCLLAARSDLRSKKIARWDVEGRSLAFKDKQLMQKKTEGFATRHVHVESAAPADDMDENWRMLLQRKEERHFQIGRIIKYLSE